MNGYRVVVYRLWDDPEAKEHYNREKSEEIYDQKVSELDIKNLVSVVNQMSQKVI